MIGIDTSPILKINRVIVTGELGCDIRLGSGLNIIKGESVAGDPTSSNDCGKTTFTELIKYGLGDRSRFSSGKIAGNIKLLYLEVSVNNKVITIQRDLNKYAARVGVFLKGYSTEISSQEPDILVNPQTPFSDFLLEQLGLPNLKIPLSSKPGTQPTPLSFQTFMRLFYMNQKDSFQEILYRVQPDWLKGKIVEVMLGMAKEEVEQLKSRVQELTNNIDELQKEINNVTKFLATSSRANRIEINDELIERNRGLEYLYAEIAQVKQKMVGGKGLTDELRETLAKLEKQLILLRDNRAKIVYKINDFEGLQNSLRVDRDKILKTKDAAFILSSVDFVKCPRCLQPITSEMRQREEVGNCMVCERPMISRTSGTNILDKDEIVDEEILEVQLLLDTYRKNLEELDLQITSLADQKSSVQQELDRRSASYVSPFIDTLERLLSNVSQTESEIELLKQQLTQWNHVEKREEWLNKRKDEKNKILSQIREIDTGDDTKIRKLSEYYELFLRRVEDPELVTARISPSDLMPLINEKPYTEDAGLGWQSVRTIAYHFSIFLFSLNVPCYYPRFLMLDSPRAFDLNSKSYELLLHQFYQIGEKLSDSDYQIILTTRNLPEELEEFVIERLNNQTRMLLRPKGEREQSTIPVIQ